MEIRQGYSYHIKDEFFELVQDKYLMSNKEQGNYWPYYYAIQDKKNPELYWMIPISSQAEKYKGIIEKKRYGKCIQSWSGYLQERKMPFWYKMRWFIKQKNSDYQAILDTLKEIIEV